MAREWAAFWVLAAVILVVRVCYTFSLPVNSDEPQHLHVAWGWTQGMVQYRDYFDNHTPLFHLMMAPLVKWLEERADILVWMRTAMLPFFAVILGCVAWLGTRLDSRRVGMWAALFSASCPVFLLTASQFRTDVLWAALWVATLAVGLAGRFTRLRAFAMGLLLGMTFAVSMKTSLLLVSLLCACGLVFWLSPESERNTLAEARFSKGLLALAGLCVVPLALIVFFATQQALPAFYYGVLKHNTLLSHSGGITALWKHFLLFPALLPVIVWGGRAILRMGEDRSQAIRRALVFLTGALFVHILYCFWPLVTRQDFLPVVPLFALVLTPLLLNGVDRVGKSGVLLLALVAMTQVTWAAWTASPFRAKDLRSETLVGDVLRLTRSSDLVMDDKGETIFRRRPFYYVLENITQELIEKGVIPDTIAAEMVKTRTCVVVLNRLPPKTSSRLPHQTLKWVERFYIPVTWRLFVAGCFLPPAAPAPAADGLRHFEVGVAANYVVVSAEGPVRGTLDGVPCDGPVFLNPGAHTFSSNSSQVLAVIWSQAVETRFCPQFQFSPPAR